MNTTTIRRLIPSVRHQLPAIALDKAIVERIFEPFFTTRLAGSGLGLATVREIVREHGGAMNVWSEPGVGSRFEVWLPCIRWAAPAVRDAMPVLGQGQTVLIVNEAAERLLADEEMLAALGYEPVGFTHIDDAAAACREIPNRFDAAVMGYRAPVASALDLASALHEILPDVPILLATASGDEITVDTLLAAGVSAVVNLPLVSAEIAWALARCLRALDSNELHNTETVSRKLTSALLPLPSRDRA